MQIVFAKRKYFDPNFNKKPMTDVMDFLKAILSFLKIKLKHKIILANYVYRIAFYVRLHIVGKY